MNILWAQSAWTDYVTHWQHPQFKKDLKRLNGLIEECTRTPYEGTGKPEALKHELTGFWSRRITQEHRLVYRVRGDTLEIASCLHHYS